MRDSPRLRAFIDFAVEEFEAQAGALNPAPWSLDKVDPLSRRPTSGRRGSSVP
jgi:hypothetical protein